MESAIVYWGYVGVTEKKLETIIVIILRTYRDNGTENGKHYGILAGKGDVVHIGEC